MKPADRLAWLTALAPMISGDGFKVAFAISRGFGRTTSASAHRVARALKLPLVAVLAIVEALQVAGVVVVESRWKSGAPRTFAPGRVGVPDARDLAVAEAMAARRELRAVRAELRRRARAA